MITRTMTQDLSTLEPATLTWTDGISRNQVDLENILTIGRHFTNLLVVEDEFVSGRHCRIERREYDYCLRDLRSRNGTFLNGSRVYEAILSDGDRIRVGGRELIFSLGRREKPNLLTSRNIAWHLQLQRLPNIARAPFPVLLTGPSGTGKDVLAQTIHRLSSRKEGPFVSVNCSALSESLVESELFGHVKGSFTGALTDRKGAFESARGGTLFLDEIGDLPLALQPKLLRALENNQIRPVGSDRSIETDARIVAATHHDLAKLVQEGRFRADLFYRLHVIQMSCPALRDRLEDFEDLLLTFARELRVRFSFQAIQRLKRHSWPGNVRELRNTVARAKAYFTDREVTEQDVEFLLGDKSEDHKRSESEHNQRSVVEQMEAELIRRYLAANHGNQRRTAAELRMAKSTLHDRIKAYGIDVEQYKRAPMNR